MLSSTFSAEVFGWFHCRSHLLGKQSIPQRGGNSYSPKATKARVGFLAEAPLPRQQAEPPLPAPGHILKEEHKAGHGDAVAQRPVTG